MKLNETRPAVLRSLLDAEAAREPRPRVSLGHLIAVGYPVCALLGAVTGWMVKP